jgi:glycerophosphoryl diester phosphodiesterase
MKLKCAFLLTSATIGSLVIMSLPSCSTSGPNTLWIAHRGAPGGSGSPQTTHFENIVEAYEKAGLENFYGLETDVYRTNDGG